MYPWHSLELKLPFQHMSRWRCGKQGNITWSHPRCDLSASELKVILHQSLCPPVFNSLTHLSLPDLPFPLMLLILFPSTLSKTHWASSFSMYRPHPSSNYMHLIFISIKREKSMGGKCKAHCMVQFIFKTKSLETIFFLSSLYSISLGLGFPWLCHLWSCLPVCTLLRALSFLALSVNQLTGP